MFIITAEGDEVCSQLVVPSVTLTLYDPLTVASSVEDISPGIITSSLYHTYDGEEASVTAVNVDGPHEVRVPVIVAEGRGVIVTDDGDDVCSQFVVPFFTLTLYDPLAVTTSVDDVSPPISTSSLYQTYDGDAASLPAVSVVDPQALSVPLIVAVGRGFTVTADVAEVCSQLVLPFFTLNL